MKITILAVGKIREPYLRAGCELYLKRLRPLMPVAVREVKAGSMDTEAKALLGALDRGAVLWALDRAGEQLASTGLAKKLADLGRSGANALAFAIGGSDGLHATVVKRAQFRWSLSDLTLLHEMTRLVVLEQLYRAAKINRGEPYHK